MAAVTGRGSQHVGRIFRYVWRHHAARAQAEVTRAPDRRKRSIADLRASTPLSCRRHQGRCHHTGQVSTRPDGGQESDGGQEEVRLAGAGDRPVGGGDETRLAPADPGRLS